MSSEIVLLTNPTAGSGKAANFASIATAKFQELGYSVRNIKGSNITEAVQLTQSCLAAGASQLVVCGGDGLVHHILPLVVNSSVKLGLIPAGTGNDVARYFAIPVADPAAAAEIIARQHLQTIDVGKVSTIASEKYFITVLAAGFDARVNERANQLNWPKGPMRYNLATLLELKNLQPISYQVKIDDEAEISLAATLIAISNGASFGGGLQISAGADLQDGYLDFVIVKPVTRRGLLRAYPQLFNGKITVHPNYQRRQIRKIQLDSADLVAYADGERIGSLPVQVEVVPQALHMLVP